MPYYVDQLNFETRDYISAMQRGDLRCDIWQCTCRRIVDSFKPQVVNPLRPVAHFTKMD